jgi:hypothetical protein
MLKPTAEQRTILDAGGRVVKINARAGTGKTATLSMIARKHPEEKILYLVFNSRNRQEAKGKFPGNVDVHTIHSFALSASGGKYDGFASIRPSHFLSQFGAKREVLSTLTQMFLVYFLNSPHPRLEDATEPFKAYLPAELQALFEREKGRIVEVARKATTGWYREKKNCPHDFYLKLSHRDKKFQGKLARYDRVLVDEGQDLSPIMIDALSGYRGRIVLVGDTHQQIYGFRYAEDAMRRFPHDELYDLTLSFRFGPRIANFTTRFIRHGKDEAGFVIRGDRGKMSRVCVYDALDSLAWKEETAILCRTNFALFKNAMALRAKKKGFRFERDISAELYRTLDVYWLRVDERDRIRDELIQSFGSIEDLKDYAEALEDYQLLKMADIVEEYELEFPEIVYELLKLCRERGEGREESITLSTIHAAKGQEYDNVVLDEDVISNLGGFEGVSRREEEINAVYVGMTRTKKNLYLPVAMKTLFDDAWQRYAEGIPAVQAGRGVRARRAGGPAAGRSPGDGGASVPRRQGKAETLPAIRIGDRVRTPNGCGVVVEVKGKECLVQLENRKARVWERRSALVGAQGEAASKAFGKKSGSARRR